MERSNVPTFQPARIVTEHSMKGRPNTMTDLDHLRQLLAGVHKLLGEAEHHPAGSPVSVALISDARAAVRHALDGLPGVVSEVGA